MAIFKNPMDIMFMYLIHTSTRQELNEIKLTLSSLSTDYMPKKIRLNFCDYIFEVNYQSN